MKCQLTMAALVLLIFAPASGVFGQDAEEADAPVDPAVAYQAAADSVDTDLAAALKELSEVRRQIAEEKPAIALATREVAADLRDKRRRAELARQQRDALIHDLQALSNRVGLWRDESVYIDSLLADFKKQQQAHASVAAFQDLLDGNEGVAEDAVGLALVEDAFIDLLKVQRQGGRILEGSALNRDGVAVDGTFIEVGPVAWFVAESGELAGLAVEGRDLRPEVVPGTGSADEIRGLARGDEVSPAFDPTLGAALALDEVEAGFVEHVRQGGLWIYPILLLALVAIVVAVLKWLQIARIREVSPAVVRRVIDAVNDDDSATAETAVAELSHPAAKVLSRGIATADRPRDIVEEALYEEYIAAQPSLQRGLPLIAIAFATAPLLGLLGTVTGMIATFQRIRVFGTSDTNVIAGGISEALVTTMFGLAVAIPALIVHALLSRRVQGIRSAMEMTSLAFINGLETCAEKEAGREGTP